MKKDERRKTCIVNNRQCEICDSHSATNTDQNILQATSYQLAFWRSVVLHLQSLAVPGAYPEDEGICLSERLLTVYQATLLNFPEDLNLKHRRVLCCVIISAIFFPLHIR